MTPLLRTSRPILIICSSDTSGRPEEAVPLLEFSAALGGALGGRAHLTWVAAVQRLVLVYEQSGQSEKARQWSERLMEGRRGES